MDEYITLEEAQEYIDNIIYEGLYLDTLKDMGKSGINKFKNREKTSFKEKYKKADDFVRRKRDEIGNNFKQTAHDITHRSFKDNYTHIKDFGKSKLNSAKNFIKNDAIPKDAVKNSIMYRRVHDELMKKANDPNISENERLKLLRKAEGAKMKKERWKAQGVGTIIQNTAGPLLPIPGTTPMLMGAKKVFINNMDKTISRKRKENKQKYSRSAVIGDFLLEAYVDDDIDNDMLLYFYNDLM